MYTIPNVLLLSALLFSIGAYGVISRRNILLVLMSVEIMLSSVSLTVLAFARGFQGTAGTDGHVLVVFNMAVAAAEAAIGLALVVAFHRHFRSVDGDRATTMKG
ncbi:MAG: NADH-quinone oxidoreductase subunit NuoK [Planctomycetes bacterium]|nr:NADH-quinone oxidoreductase subunit NuoK [Planctomycetota bacterium]